MTIRNGIIAILLAVLVGVGGWYLFVNNQSAPHVLNENGDRVIKEETDYYSIQVVYPNTTRLATRTDSSKAADERAVATIEKALNGFIADFKRNVNEMLTEDEKARLTEQKTKYSLNIAYRPYNSGSFVSEEFDIYQDTGGAHPNGFYKTLVFDLTGKEVSLGDLFSNAGYLERIAAAAKTQVDAQLTARAGEDATSTVFTEGLAPKAENFSNWVDDQNTLVFLIPPYQAAAYAAGSFEVRIPIDDIKDITKPGIQ